jgi:hypothetical protein
VKENESQKILQIQPKIDIQASLFPAPTLEYPSAEDSLCSQNEIASLKFKQAILHSFQITCRWYYCVCMNVSERGYVSGCLCSDMHILRVKTESHAMHGPVQDRRGPTRQDRPWTPIRRFPPILSRSLRPHRATTRRLPSRVARYGPGGRRSGRFVHPRTGPAQEEEHYGNTSI